MAGDPATDSTRRSVVRGGIAGLAGLALGALGRPSRASAAAGNPIVMGAANTAGTTNTTLTTSSTGTAFQVNQNGTGTALRGVANNGIAGFFSSGMGAGVSGVTGNNTKFGIYAANDAASFGGGAAVRANGKQNHGLVASSDAGQTAAVTATHNGSGLAIRGESRNGNGIIGIADAPDKWGVFGWNATTTGSGVGVYGSAFSATAFGVYSAGNAHVEGNLSVSGSISKGSGSFKIDHPLDPANKYLYHSFVESPDMLNVYSGAATLDANGEATVELPAWFEAINRDIRYQLTAVGRSAPDLFVKSKLAHGRFAIGGGQPGQEVCWLLTGIRKDAFAEAHRIPVEEPKPEGDRGLYLHPIEHGQPKEKGIHASREPATAE